jgi:predicted transcriptional regulator
MTATMTTAEVAAELDTTPRTLRKYLRSADRGVGKGARYSLPATKREMASLRKKFAAWGEDEAAKKADKAQSAGIEIDEDEVADADSDD